MKKICTLLQRVNQHAKPSIIQVGCPTCCYQVCALDHANGGAADLDYGSEHCHRNDVMQSWVYRAIYIFAAWPVCIASLACSIIWLIMQWLLITDCKPVLSQLIIHDRSRWHWVAGAWHLPIECPAWELYHADLPTKNERTPVAEGEHVYIRDIVTSNMESLAR